MQVNTKNTALFLIPLAGEANDHIANFGRLEALVEAVPDAIVFKLVGSGGISAGAAMTYLDIMAELPREVERAVISYSSLTVTDFALWLGLATLRDIRPSAWVWVVDPDAIAEKCLGPDERRCFDIINKHTSLDLVKGRVLAVSELRDLLLIDTPFAESLDRCIGINAEGGIER